jgi:UDP-3-O-[3-hydroxymyristoyl] glucosamine N-acyltransferase
VDLRNLINIHPTAVVDPDTELADGVVISPFVYIREGVRIAANTIIGPFTVLEGDTFVGANTTIHSHCNIARDSYIGDNVFIGPYFIATNTKEITKGKHGTQSERAIEQGFMIFHDVRIGSNVRMVPGLRIGENSVIDMDCLITKDVPPNSHIRGGRDKVGRPY